SVSDLGDVRRPLRLQVRPAPVLSRISKDPARPLRDTGNAPVTCFTESSECTSERGAGVSLSVSASPSRHQKPPPALMPKSTPASLKGPKQERIQGAREGPAR